MSKPIQLMLDVDTGTDDSLALLYALKSDNADIVGITTSAGNVSAEQATVNTLKILQLSGYTGFIPVAKGADRPLMRPWFGVKKEFHGENGLGDYILPEGRNIRIDESAAHFIVKKVNEHPNELTLVFLGRLTNLAAAIDIDPFLPGKVKRLVIMGGALRVPGNILPTAEANIHGDPEAADIVFKSGIPLTMVGLDVTSKALLRQEHLQKLLQAPTHEQDLLSFVEYVLKFRMQAYQNKLGVYATPMHDPLAVAIALDPPLAVMEQVYVSIETQSEASLGATVEIREAESTNALVCTSIDSEAFLERFIHVLAYKVSNSD